MKLASRPPLYRLLVVDQMLRTGTYPNARQMARRLEVHRRTVYRDLDFLRDSWGAPVEFSSQHNGFYYRDPDYALPLQRLTEGELLALHLAERLLQAYRCAPHADRLGTVLRKLSAALPEEAVSALGQLDETYSFHHPPPCAAADEHLRPLDRAVREGRQLELVYWTASRDETGQRVVDPYHLTLINGTWYVVAYCHLREEVRMFAAGRIRSLRETGERFERPADFRIGDYLDGSFRAMRGSGPRRRVRLRFTAAAARYVREKEWHPTQRLREQPDGGLVLTLKVTHLLEVRRWALSWGAGCEVLEPAELRAEVRAELRQTLQSYE
jgi:predicted DNA-binding transcriptional regulator YafY